MALTNAEHQKLWRQRRDARIRELEARVAELEGLLRNEANSEPLRKIPEDEIIDPDIQQLLRTNDKAALLWDQFNYWIANAGDEAIQWLQDELKADTDRWEKEAAAVALKERAKRNADE